MATAAAGSGWILAREGEYWTLAHGEIAIRLRDSKGLRCLAALVDNPGADFHAIDLVATGEAGRAVAVSPESRPDAGDAGEMLDPAAKAAYRERLEELREDIEEAEAFNDAERAGRAREEMEFLVHELTAAVGLGGRDRRAASAAERARVNVTRSIKAALARIAEQDPLLGRQLRLSVKTGMFCSFRPVPGFSLAVGEPGAAAPAPVAAVAEPAPSAAAAPVKPVRIPIPSRLAAAVEGQFFGRTQEFELLAAEFRLAMEGQQRAVILGGEPGIGKTRLAAEVAASAHVVGATILYGRCDEELGVPYQPFVEALGHYVEHAPAHVLEQHRADHGTELARLVPHLAGPNGHGARWASGDRHVLFAAAGDLLGDASDDAPLVLILDDLQWADEPTLLLVRHLLAAPNPIRGLVIGTYRSTELHAARSLGRQLADLRRLPGVQEVELGGLGEREVLAMTQVVMGRELAAEERELARGLWRETDGNPFFVSEVVRDLKEGGPAGERDELMAGPEPAVRVPRRLREAIDHRVARLGELADRVLGSAAVIGHEFDLELLARVVGEDEDAVLDVLDTATEAALVAPTPAFGARYAFSHALVGHALYEQLRTGERLRTHRRVADALETLYAGDVGPPTPRIGELAHHAFAGIMGAADVPRALDYARRAGERAIAQLAPHEASRWYERALALHDRQAATGDELRCELLIGLGTAQRSSGDGASRATLLEAAELARGIGAGDLLVRAALANTRGFASATGVVDSERIAALEAALEAVGEADSAERAGLLATLAAELTFSGQWERRLAVSDDALAIVRRLGEPIPLAQVLSTRFMTIWTPETLAERDANTAEELEIAERHGDALARFSALHWRAIVCVESGRLAEAAQLVERETEIAERLRQPTAHWLAAYDGATQALMHGRLDAAEQAAERAGKIAMDSQQPEALAFWVGQLINIRYEQGRLMELEPVIAQQVEANPGIPAFRAALALARVDGGLDDSARELLAVDGATGFAEFPYDSNWLVGLTIYAEVCGQVGDAAAAQALLALLEPYGDQVAFNSATAWGLVARHLGNLDAMLGRAELAVERLRDALARHERMGAPIWAARTRLDLARALGAGPEAHMLAEAALKTARELGCAGIERRASALLS